MTIKLVSDSTCDLPPDMMARYGINIVPINIQFGTETYKENITINAATFYDKVLQNNIFPQTSQPSVGEFAEVYTALAQETDEIISAHVGAKLSGTYQSAKLAAAQVADKVTVHVIDSMAGSAGLGWMMVEAGELIARGKSALDIKAHLEAKRSQISIFLALDSLKFAQLSGRVGKITGFLGSVLDLKPIIGLDNGLLEASHKARSHKSAMRRIVELTVQKIGNRPVNVSVLHALAEDRAQSLLEMAHATLNVQSFYITDVAISIAVHFGPGTVGLVAYPADEAL